MPLRPASRIPKRLNRPTSNYTRSLVRKRHRGRSVNRGKQTLQSFGRKIEKMGRIIARECKFWLVILTIGSVAATAGMLMFSSIFNVKSINVKRQDARLDIESIQRALSPLFDSRLYLVSKSDVSELLEGFPDVIAIDMQKDYPSNLTVALHLDPLVAELSVEGGAERGTGSVLGDADPFFFLTSRGYVVSSPTNLSSGALPLFTVRDWGIRPVNHTHLLSEELLLTIFRSRDMLADTFGLPVTGTTVFLRAREFHLASNERSFWFDAASPLEEQFENLRSFLRTLTLEDAREYIDLRLSGKVVYK